MLKILANEAPVIGVYIRPMGPVGPLGPTLSMFHVVYLFGVFENVTHYLMEKIIRMAINYFIYVGYPLSFCNQKIMHKGTYLQVNFVVIFLVFLKNIVCKDIKSQRKKC